MSEKPSWHSSTLSQMAMIGLGAYLVAAGTTLIGAVWFGLSAEKAALVMAPFEVVFTGLVMGYAVARKTNGMPPTPPGAV